MMYDERVYSSFFETALEKQAALNPLQVGMGNVGKFLRKGFDPVSHAVQRAQDYNIYGRALGGAALGAGTGAIADKDNRLRGALIGGGIGGVVGGAGPWALRQGLTTAEEGAKILQRPIHSLKKNWQDMSRRTPEELAKAKEKLKGTSITQDISESVQDSGLVPQRVKDYLKRKGEERTKALQQRYRHLTKEPAEKGLRAAWRRGEGVKGKAKEVAEELSRSGYTGAGKYTKYLPTGEKALTLGFMGASAPTFYQAATGQTPVSEAVGEVGSQLGYLAGASTGFIPSMAISELARAGFAAPARVVERALSRGQQQPARQWEQPAGTGLR